MFVCLFVCVSGPGGCGGSCGVAVADVVVTLIAVIVLDRVFAIYIYWFGSCSLALAARASLLFCTFLFWSASFLFVFHYFVILLSQCVISYSVVAFVKVPGSSTKPWAWPTVCVCFHQQLCLA